MLQWEGGGGRGREGGGRDLFGGYGVLLLTNKHVYADHFTRIRFNVWFRMLCGVSETVSRSLGPNGAFRMALYTVCTCRAELLMKDKGHLSIKGAFQYTSLYILAIHFYS